MVAQPQWPTVALPHYDGTARHQYGAFLLHETSAAKLTCLTVDCELPKGLKDAAAVTFMCFASFHFFLCRARQLTRPFPAAARTFIPWLGC